jgi:hypothetical protein
MARERRGADGSGSGSRRSWSESSGPTMAGAEQAYEREEREPPWPSAVYAMHATRNGRARAGRAPKFIHAPPCPLPANASGSRLQAPDSRQPCSTRTRTWINSIPSPEQATWRCALNGCRLVPHSLCSADARCLASLPRPALLTPIPPIPPPSLSSPPSLAPHAPPLPYLPIHVPSQVRRYRNALHVRHVQPHDSHARCAAGKGKPLTSGPSARPST